ncbi:MAG: lysoplasmalogenase [Acidobacteriota bacterium]
MQGQPIVRPLWGCSRSVVLAFCGAVAVLAVSAFFVALALDLHLVRVLVKPWPVLALALWVYAAGRRPYAGPIVIGLLLSAAGDVLLELSAATFLPGVGAFLLAHVAYIVAFVGEEQRVRWLRALPFAIWGVAVVLWLRPGLDAAGMLIPVAIYTATICAMMWRAVARLGNGDRGARLAAVGAVVFAASDTLIAIQRFGDDLAFQGIRVAIMVLYWFGQTLLAASAVKSPTR